MLVEKKERNEVFPCEKKEKSERNAGLFNHAHPHG